MKLVMRALKQVLLLHARVRFIMQIVRQGRHLSARIFAESLISQWLDRNTEFGPVIGDPATGKTWQIDR